MSHLPPDPSPGLAPRITDVQIEDRPASLFDYLLPMLRHRRLLLLTPTLLAVAAGAYTFANGRSYKAESRFVSESRQGTAPAGLAGLAAQFGVSVGGGAGASPSFYEALLGTRTLLRKAAQTQYTFKTPDGRTLQGDVPHLLKIDVQPPSKALDQAVLSLQGMASASTDPKTGIVTLTVTSKWPEFAVQVNRRLLDLVNEYNLKQRQSAAGAQREFAEGVMNGAKEELNAAENRLSDFLASNRIWQSSPQLSTEKARLEQDVTMKQQVYLSLEQSYEQARIDEVRNTPVITVVDTPENNVRPASRGPITTAVFCFMVIALVLVGGIYAWEFFRGEARRHPDVYQEVARLAPVPGRMRRMLVRGNGG